MKNFISDFSQTKAVTALKFLYPLWLIIGPFSLLYVPSKIIIGGDAAATAQNIMAHELLFRLGIAGSLITQIIQILVVLVLFVLLKPVNKNHAVLMLVFALVGVPMAMYNSLNQIAALTLLSTGDYLNVLGIEQLQIQMLFFLELDKQGIFIPSIFWGLWLFPLGFLVYKSGYFPRFLGLALVLGGVSYVVDAFSRIILPEHAAFEATFGTLITVLAYGELPFMLWILIKGADLPKSKS